MGGNNSGNVKQFNWVTQSAGLVTEQHFLLTLKPSLVGVSGMRTIGQGISMHSGDGQLLCMLYLDQ